jgi:ribonuclease P protein component
VNQRLTKAERILRRADYLRIQGGGRKLHTSSFVCFGMQPLPSQALPASDLPTVPQLAPGVDNSVTRLGITVSKRVGCSVVRNRVKRLVREAFRRQKQAFPGGLELVLIARAEAAKASYAQVERELSDLGRRVSTSGIGRSVRSK